MVQKHYRNVRKLEAVGTYNFVTLSVQYLQKISSNTHQVLVLGEIRINLTCKIYY